MLLTDHLNLIPVLEIYDKGEICETIEATEFSEILQDILEDIHWINQKYGSDECLECNSRKMCKQLRLGIQLIK